mgnify:CR=1 FL=1
MWRWGEIVISKPHLIVSACLGSNRCRYDGEMLSCPALADILCLADVRFVCPEIAIGLGVPRHPIRLVADGGRVRMMQTVTHRDLTEEMEHFCESFLAALDPARVDGFILKSRSPSCALSDAKIYAPDMETLVGTGPGLFGAAVLRLFPHTPAEDESTLGGSKTYRSIIRQGRK